MKVEQMQERIARIAERQRLREVCPEFTAFVDEFRKVFGAVKVKWIRFQDGTEKGRRSPHWRDALPDKGVAWERKVKLVID